ncbi:DUF4276 family protein [Pseudoduganella namucuonensis]|uniref:DUF4276 family protein n=1 Tax=Pseudoduganella namucuonensis TaxID=1035707 RepID=UPI0015A59A23|nr:DUF4276 family protein [Pseudoduganella namucuonensis]
MRGVVLAVEDELSEQIGLRLVAEVRLQIDLVLRKGGNGYLKSKFISFCEMAHQTPVLLITDLDSIPTVEKLKVEWLNKTKPPNSLLFHVAVREVESWLLADHRGMKKMMGKNVNKFPAAPDDLADPKAHLLSLAASAARDVRDDLIAERGSMATQGLGYNKRLSTFVRQIWDPEAAEDRSPSLRLLRQDLVRLAETI